jgi:hypothetical protein
MNARWLRRLSDLSQRHRTALKYHLRAPDDCDQPFRLIATRRSD